MTSTTLDDGVLDEAYERLRDTGPERNGWLSNHAPMAAEGLISRGQTGEVHTWLDRYASRLEDRPRGIAPIPADGWRDPLGDLPAATRPPWPRPGTR